MRTTATRMSWTGQEPLDRCLKKLQPHVVRRKGRFKVVALRHKRNPRQHVALRFPLEQYKPSLHALQVPLPTDRISRLVAPSQSTPLRLLQIKDVALHLWDELFKPARNVLHSLLQHTNPAVATKTVTLRPTLTKYPHPPLTS